MMRLRTLALTMALIPAAAAWAQDRAPAPLGVAASPSGQQPARATIYAEPVALMIAAYDADGDGKVTRAECLAGVEHGFNAIDTTHKGWLGYVEFADWAERWLGDRNALPSPFETDADGDNRITLAELQAKIMTSFDRFDRNHDGAVTRAELLTLAGSRTAGPRNGTTGDAPRRGRDRRGQPDQ